MSPQFIATLTGIAPQWLPSVPEETPKPVQLVHKSQAYQAKWEDKTARIMAVLVEAERPMSVREICELAHMSETPVYLWLVANENAVVKRYPPSVYRGPQTWSLVRQPETVQ